MMLSDEIHYWDTISASCKIFLARIVTNKHRLLVGHFHPCLRRHLRWYRLLAFRRSPFQRRITSSLHQHLTLVVINHKPGLCIGPSRTIVYNHHQRKKEERKKKGFIIITLLTSFLACPVSSDPPHFVYVNPTV